MASKTINTILSLTDRFSKPLQKTTENTKKFKKQIKEAELQAQKMRKGINGAFNGMALKVGGVVAGLGVAQFAKDSLMLASDLQEVQNVVDTTFGGMSKTVGSFASKAGKNFGMSELQAKQFSGTLGAMMKSTGATGNELTKMSTDLAGLSGDFASFYNTDPQQAFEDIKSAMAGGTETMLKYGVNMQVAAMQEYMHAKGINKKWEKLTQLEKTQLRYNYIMEKTKDAQGDYLKTNQGFANGLRTLTLKLKDMGAKVMAYAVPPLSIMFQDWIKFLDSVDIDAFMTKAIDLGKKGFGYLATTVRLLRDNMNWLLPVASTLLGTFVAFNVITSISTAVLAFKKATDGLTIAQMILNATMLANPFMQWALAIGVLIGLGVALWKNWDVVKVKATALWTSLTATMGKLNNAFVSTFKAIGSFSLGIVKGIANTYIDMFNFIIRGINKLQFKTPDWVPMIGGKTVGANIPTIPRFAMGTQYHKGGIAQINERGGEIVDLPNGSRVYPADKSAKMMNGGGVVVNLNIQGNMIGNEQYARYIGGVIAKDIQFALVKG